MQFKCGEYHSISMRCVLTFNSMSSHTAPDLAFQTLQSSQMTKTLIKKTCPMTRKQWLALQLSNPPMHLLFFAQDIDSDFLQANRLICHIHLAFTPSSRYPGTTAHAARGFFSLPTHALVRPREMGHVARALAWAKTNTFRRL